MKLSNKPKFSANKKAAEAKTKRKSSKKKTRKRHEGDTKATQSEAQRNENEAKTKTKSVTKTTRRRHEAMTVTIAITGWFCFWAQAGKKAKCSLEKKSLEKNHSGNESCSTVVLAYTNDKRLHADGRRRQNLGRAGGIGRIHPAPKGAGRAFSLRPPLLLPPPPPTGKGRRPRSRFARRMAVRQVAERAWL